MVMGAGSGVEVMIVKVVWRSVPVSGLHLCLNVVWYEDSRGGLETYRRSLLQPGPGCAKLSLARFRSIDFT